MLVDRGLLYRNGGGWQLREGELPLPESVQGIIAARLDALQPEREARAPRRGGDRPRLLARGGRGRLRVSSARTSTTSSTSLERKEFVRRVAHERRRERAPVLVPSRARARRRVRRRSRAPSEHRSTGSRRRGSSRSGVPRTTRRRSRTTTSLALEYAAAPAARTSSPFAERRAAALCATAGDRALSLSASAKLQRATTTAALELSPARTPSAPPALPASARPHRAARPGRAACSRRRATRSCSG